MNKSLISIFEISVLKLIPCTPWPNPCNANDIAEFTSIHSLILASLVVVVIVGFNISHFVPPKYSWKYKSKLLIHAKVPVRYILSIFSSPSEDLACTAPIIVYKTGNISSKYLACSPSDSIFSIASLVYIVVFLNASYALAYEFSFFSIFCNIIPLPSSKICMSDIYVLLIVVIVVFSSKFTINTFSFPDNSATFVMVIGTGNIIPIFLPLSNCFILFNSTVFSLIFITFILSRFVVSSAQRYLVSNVLALYPFSVQYASNSILMAFSKSFLFNCENILKYW